MIKLLALGLAAVGATLLGSYAAAMLASPGSPAAAPEPEAIEVVKLDPVSVPVIRQGKVQGYVIARAAIMATAAEVKKHKPALVIYAGEAIFQAIYEEEAFDFAAMKPAKISALGDRIAMLANQRLGRAAIRQLAVESLNFLTPAETRKAFGR